MQPGPWFATYPGGLCLLLEDLLHLHRQVLHQLQAIDFLHSDRLEVFFMFLESEQTHGHRQTEHLQTKQQQQQCLQGEEDGAQGWSLELSEQLPPSRFRFTKGGKTSGAFPCCCSVSTLRTGSQMGLSQRLPGWNTRWIKSSRSTQRLIVFIRLRSLAAYAASDWLEVAVLGGWRVSAGVCVCVLEGYVRVRRVIEMESKHRKIITCRARLLVANEVRRARR